jgi:two-component system, NtrC family, sensor kinase
MSCPAPWIEGAIAVRVPALGEVALRLSWLPPSAASLVALAQRPSAATWTQVRADPGCVLLLARHAPAALLPGLPSPFPALLRDAPVLEEALRLLDAQDAGPVDWGQPPAGTIYQAAIAYALKASQLARHTGRLDPETAWVGGLLAPLGWLAACAVDASLTAECLADPAYPESSAPVQCRLWGLDTCGIARRLARRWRLPAWLGTVVGHLTLPAETAQALGAEPDLFRLIQLAVVLVQRQTVGLGLAVGTGLGELATALGLSATELDGLTSAPTDPVVLPEWTGPAAVPLLRDLLGVAAENRRLADAPVLERLENDVDHLHRTLEERRSGDVARLQADKLSTLAEFAAGAGHEINNPLAVISGQAQYLLGHEAEPARQRSLQTIIAQTQRIHDLLTELMQFARPPRPQKRPMDLGSLIREVTVSLSDLATQRQVRLVSTEPEQPLDLDADPRQLRTALTCLLRNAIEAAPADGWAGVRVQLPAPDRLDLIVEDNGAGPTPPQREHMFDPFYSGRQAGRGRGLGLPTAWRLAREHGGDVYFDDLSGGPTRFVLTLPRALESNGTLTNGHAEAG